MSLPSRRSAVSGLAETLDRLITLELPQNWGRSPASRPASRGVTPDGVGQLYGAARRRLGWPLADGAAAAEQDRSQKVQCVPEAVEPEVAVTQVGEDYKKGLRIVK